MKHQIKKLRPARLFRCVATLPSIPDELTPLLAIHGKSWGPLITSPTMLSVNFAEPVLFEVKLRRVKSARQEI